MYPKPDDEVKRLAFLSLNQLNERPDRRTLDHLTALAAEIFETPIALVTLVTEHDQWFHGRTGLSADGTSRGDSFCAHAITSDQPLIVSDATRDPRFAGNPLVIGEPRIRFYAGAPITTREGVRLGAFCLIDRKARAVFSAKDIRALTRLANIAAEHFETYHLEAVAEMARGFAEASALSILTTDADGVITSWNSAAEHLFGFPRALVVGKQTELIIPERFQVAHRAGMERLKQGGAKALVGKAVEVIARRADGTEVPIELSLSAWPTTDGVAFGAHAQDISARRAREAKLEHLAEHDHLTGLSTLRKFCECLHERLQEERSATILKLDIEKFKGINDSLGRSVGDALLQAITVRLHTVAGQDWEIGRSGSDEFVFLLPTPADLFAMRDAAQALIAAFQQSFHVDGHQIHLSVSIGAAFSAQDEDSAEELLFRADLAMTRAKSQGGGKYRVFDDTMRAQLVARRAMNEELRLAHAAGQWQLHYQPQVRMSDGVLIGAEALLRWQHPQRGLLLPAAFIPALERHLVAFEVGSWVLDESCRQLASWRAQGLDIPCISCNLFATQVHTPGLAKMVATSLSRYNLQPSDLELEITETIALNLDRATIDPLATLVKRGVRVALDDFGTGFASLTTLKHVPFTRLKIDRSFVADICVNEHSAAVIDGITSIARRLSIEVICEGVETPEQHATLRALGCDAAQGYLFGGPLSAKEFGSRFNRTAAILNAAHIEKFTATDTAAARAA